MGFNGTGDSPLYQKAVEKILKMVIKDLKSDQINQDFIKEILLQLMNTNINIKSMKKSLFERIIEQFMQNPYFADFKFKKIESMLYVPTSDGMYFV